VALRSSQADQPLDIGELLDELTIKIDRVKVLYEQYFMGIEKLEPQTSRKEVQRAMLLLQQQNIRNTGLRFKFNMMLQKWNIYTGYWNRTLREIENGTYIRHLAKARRAAEREGRELPSEMERRRKPPSGTFETIAKADAEAAPAGQAAPAPLPPKRAPMPLPAPTPAPITRLPQIVGMSERELRELHQRFLQARQANGETATVKFETLVSSLAKQVPRLLASPGVKSVRFDVAVQDGKAILKAIPTRS
jgi:hypothetical protein